MKLEAATFTMIDRDTKYVCGEQITRELDAVKGQTETSCESVSQGGFTDSGNVLDEQMSARQQTGEGETNRALLSEEYLSNLFDHGV